jgi:acyl-CoA thioester hydrolase
MSTVPKDAVSIELSVPFHDVDSLDIVWHGHYVKYIESARQELLRRHDLDIPELLGLGLHLVVSQTHLKHINPLRYYDRVRVSAWLTESRVRLDFEFEIFNLTSNQRAATARTVLAVMREGGEMLFAPPEVLRQRLAQPASQPRA